MPRSRFQSDGSLSAHREQTAWTQMERYNRCSLRPEISNETPKTESPITLERLYSPITVDFYGDQSWPATKLLEIWMDVMQMKILRWHSCVTGMDKIRIEKCKIQNLCNKIFYPEVQSGQSTSVVTESVRLFYKVCHKNSVLSLWHPYLGPYGRYE